MYPFLLPDFFKTKLTKDQFEVRVEVIKVFHSVDITKTFLIQQFLDSYSTVSNQRINEIKKNFIELVVITDSTVLLIRNLPSKVKHKTKRVIIVIALGSIVWFSNLEPVEAIGLSMPPTPVVGAQPSYQHDSKVKTAKVIARKKDLIAYKSRKEILFLMYLTDPRLSSNQQGLELVKKLRGGSWAFIGTAAFIGLIILIYSTGAGFVPNNPNPGWGLNRPDPFQPPSGPPKDFFSPRRTPGSPRDGATLQVTRPSAVPNSDFNALSPADKRRLYDIRDMKIKHEGYPELDVGFWQSEYKVRKHGALHGLEYTIHEKNGKIKKIAKKSEENVLKMMRSIVDMANRDNVEWIDGMYQNGTKRQFEAIHIYDPSNKIIAVFDKLTRKFVTTCELNLLEILDLKATKNFGGKSKNFESDVRGMTPISPMDTSPNPGFTPINSFKSDVMNITPIDNL